MKNTILILSTLLLLTACGPKTRTVDSLDSQPSGDAVYVIVDQVLMESDIYLKEGVALEEKTRKTQEAWAKKEQSFQWEAQKLQSDYEKHLITTADAQSKQQSLERRMKAYQTSMQKEGTALEEENFVFGNRAQDLIQRAVRNVNNGRYKFVFNGSALIDADTTLNITPLVLEETNRLYKQENK